MAFIQNNWFLLIMQSVALGFAYVWLYLNKDKLKIKFWELVIFITVGFAGGFFFAKFFALLEVGFIWEKSVNYRIFGPILFDSVYIVVYGLIRKIPLGKFLDCVCVTVIVSMMLARVNCIFEGCCYGKRAFGSDYRWPIREIEILYDIILLVFAIPYIYKNKSKGDVYPAYIGTYGVIRFILEWFRDHYSSEEGAFHLAHIWSIAFIVIGSIWYFGLLIYRKRRAIVDEKE